MGAGVLPGGAVSSKLVDRGLELWSHVALSAIFSISHADAICCISAPVGVALQEDPPLGARGDVHTPHDRLSK